MIGQACVCMCVCVCVLGRRGVCCLLVHFQIFWCPLLIGVNLLIDVCVLMGTAGIWTSIYRWCVCSKIAGNG